MKPKRPYLLRALYDWIIDSDLTPYVLVQVDGPDVVVPQGYVEEGRIVLNVSPSAVRALSIEPEAMAFSGRFSGQAFNVVVPMRSVAAIYAKETGEGMMFEPEYAPTEAAAAEADAQPAASPAGPSEEDAPPSDKSDGERGSHLKVVK